MNSPPAVHLVHLVYRFGVGGLENVIVQLINRLPAERFRHTVVSLTGIDDFSRRIERPDVRLIALDKPPGHAVPLYPKLFRLLRELRPDVLHTCNLAALEAVPLAWLAGVPRRIHAEHGWDVHDPDGSSPRYRLLRRLYRPFVSHYVAVSADLDRYLGEAIGVPADRRSLIANGVDLDRFRPAAGRAAAVPGCPFEPGRHWLVGTVGRLQTIKHQTLLARAFVRLRNEDGEAAARMRLVIVGDGPLREELTAILERGGALDSAWLPGERGDVADCLRMLDCFVLPSLAEGTSCTLQEAMACGLPVIATAVGGTPALIEDGVDGRLVPADDERALATAIGQVCREAADSAALAARARETAVRRFALEAMVARYADLFSGP